MTIPVETPVRRTRSFQRRHPGHAPTSARRSSGSKRLSDANAYARSAAAHQLPLPAKLFLCALIVPWLVPIGPLAITVYRLILIGVIVPCLWQWASGKAGRIRLADL